MRAAEIIVAPVITEKAMDMLAMKRYAFKVAKTATRADVKAAVEEMFDGTKVANVRIINVSEKPKRLGVHAGFSGAWKKAIVTLTEESKTIAFFDSLN